MGRRVAVNSTTTVNDLQHITTPVTVKKTIRKRKYVANAKSSTKAARINSNHHDNWHENADDEDSSSNDTVDQMPARNLSCKHANNSSILLNGTFNNSSFGTNEFSSSMTESPKPVYVLRPSMVNGTILSDLGQRPWRLGKPIGKGNFGEIFLASDNITVPVTNDNAKFVVKIEPHSNGPLFVEIHCLMNTAKKNCLNTNYDPIPPSIEDDIPQMAPSGIPDYIASGSHYFGDARYRFLVLQRFDHDLHSLIRNSRVTQKTVLTLAIHILTVLENLHNEGYCHNDVKAQNLMISKCKFYKTKLSKAKKLMNGSSGGGGGNSKSVQQKQEGAIAKQSSGKPSKRKLNFKNSHFHHYDEKQQTTDSGNSSEQDFNDDYEENDNEDSDNDNDEDEDDDEDECIIKREKRRRAKPLRDEDYDYDVEDDEEDEDDDKNNENDDDDEDFDDSVTSNSNNTNSLDGYLTPMTKNSRQRRCRNMVQFSGSNPVRSCRREKPNAVYDEMVKSHYLRPTKRVSYTEFFNEDIYPLKEQNSPVDVSMSSDDSDEFIPDYIRSNQKKNNSSNVGSNSTRKRTRRNEDSHNHQRKSSSNQKENLRTNHNNRYRSRKSSQRSNGDNESANLNGIYDGDCSQHEKQYVLSEEERIFLIDYGLASKYMDNGIHRPFIMDQRRAHDGTLEFTSRDAHMGAHSRRSDLECLGYNLLYWSQGYLPWKEAAQQQQQEKVHRAKEFLMTDVREMLKQIYGKQVPKYLGEFLHQVGELHFDDRPNYERYRNLFKREYENLGYDSRDMALDSQEIIRTSVKVREEDDLKCDIFELNKHNALAWSALKNCSISSPYQESSNGISRISPKNLRSKSDKKTVKKKKFSWAEILSQDPDQIARERAEKEFTREEESNDVQQKNDHRYEGKPTYAILEIQRRLMERGKWIDYDTETPKAKVNGSLLKQQQQQVHKSNNNHNPNLNHNHNSNVNGNDHQSDSDEDDGEEEVEEEDEGDEEDDDDDDYIGEEEEEEENEAGEEEEEDEEVEEDEDEDEENNQSEDEDKSEESRSSHQRFIEEPENDVTMDSEVCNQNEDTIDSVTSSIRKRGRPRKDQQKSVTKLKNPINNISNYGKKSLSGASQTTTTSRSTNSSRKTNSSSSSTATASAASAAAVTTIKENKSKKSCVTFCTKTQTRGGGSGGSGNQQNKTKVLTSSSGTSSSISGSSSSSCSSTSSSSSSSLSSSSTLSIQNSTIQQNNNFNHNNHNGKEKRCGGGATKTNRKTNNGCNSLSQAIAASAAGEVGHDDHYAKDRKSSINNNHGDDDEDSNKPLSQRRTRRCLLKTEKAMRNAVLVDQEDSNSNFTSDMRTLYLNNENVYYKSSLVAAAAASKHYKK